MIYLPFVDGLRAVAIIAVVLFHAFPALVPGGFAGVDVFFVISGFLITRFIAAEMHAGTFSFSQFYIRRARRLLPAAVVCLLCISALAGFVLLPDAYHYFGRSLLASILMYANIFFYTTGGYFSAPALEKPLLHIWSLAVEDQFYLTWPLMLAGLVGLPRRATLSIVLLLAAASLAYAEIKITTDPEFAFFQLPPRAWELLTGAVVALAEPPRLRPALANVLAATGAAAVLLSFVFASGEGHFPGLGAAPACLGTAAIISVSLKQPTCISRLLSLKPVIGIGLISYSLYLWHWPLLALLRYHLERQANVTEVTATLALAVGLAWLSWRYVERPFRHARQQHLKHGSEDRSFIVGAACATASIIAVAIGLKFSHGWPQRYDVRLQAVLNQMIAENPLRSACDNYQNILRHDDVCDVGRQRAPGESYDVAVFGDSMADQWMDLAADYAKRHSLALRQVTNGGCGLFIGSKVPARPAAKARECEAYVAAAQTFIAANPGLKLAVISGFWEKWIGRFEHPQSRADVPPPASEGETHGAPLPTFDSILKQTLEPFTSRGIKVLLIGQIPIYETLPLRCIADHVEAGRDASECGLERDTAMRQVERSNAALLRAAAASPLVSVTLPSQRMCATKFCSPFAGETFLYRNATHLNSLGAVALYASAPFPL